MTKEKLSKAVFTVLLILAAGCFHTSVAGAADTAKSVKINSTTPISIEKGSGIDYVLDVPYKNMHIKVNITSVKFDNFIYDITYKKPAYSIQYSGRHVSRSKNYFDNYEETFTVWKEGKVTIHLYGYNSDMTGNMTITDVSDYATSVSASDMLMNIGTSLTAKPSVLPANAAIGNFIYTSADTSIAAVNADGTVIGVSAGTTTINVKEPITGISTNFNVKVESPAIYTPPQKETGTTDPYTYPAYGTPSNATNDGATISVKGASKIKMETGESHKLKINSNIDNPTVSYSTSNSKIVTVNSSGKIKAKKLGAATVTATSKGGNSVKWTVIVNKTYIDLMEGKTRKCSSLVKYIKKQSKGKWSVSDKSVAQVSGKKIKGIDTGDTNITLKANGIKYTIKTYVSSKTALKNSALSRLKSILKNPNSLIVNDMFYAGGSYFINYSATNSFGAYVSGKFYAWFDEGRLEYFTNE